MFEHRALPYLRALSDGVILSRTLKLFGIGESAMEARLREKMNNMSNPTLAPYAKEGECELRITAHAPTEEAAHALIAPVEADVRGPLRRPGLRRRHKEPGVGRPSSFSKTKVSPSAPPRAVPAASSPSVSPICPGPPPSSRAAW